MADNIKLPDLGSEISRQNAISLGAQKFSRDILAYLAAASLRQMQLWGLHNFDSERVARIGLAP